MQVKKDLSIVIPALNEAANLDILLAEIKKLLAGRGISYEIIVVDGGSIDNTEDVCQRNGVKVMRQSGPGFGGALKEGFANAQGDYIVTMDADLSHEPHIILELYAKRGEAEMVIASRYVEGGGAEMNGFRRFLSVLLNKSYSRILSLPYGDLSSNFRMYKRQTVQGLRIKARHFDVLEEILIKIYCDGWKVIEIPFVYRPRGAGNSHARLLKFGYHLARTLYRMWRLRNSIRCADYDERAFDSRIFLQRYWQKKRYEITHFLHSRDNSVLDIGCGSSKIIQSMPQAVGLDIQINKLRYIRCTNKRLVRASIFALPFKDGVFGEIICSNVIEHILPQKIIFEEMIRVTKNNGSLIIATPDYSRPSWVWLERGYELAAPGAYGEEHITHYSLATLREKLMQFGLKVNAIRYIAGSELILRAVK